MCVRVCVMSEYSTVRVQVVCVCACMCVSVCEYSVYSSESDGVRGSQREPQRVRGSQRGSCYRRVRWSQMESEGVRWSQRESERVLLQASYQTEIG